MSQFTGQSNVMSEGVVNLPASIDDVREIVRIHLAAFPGFFLSQMGPRFLAEYYKLILEFDAGIIIKAEVEGRMQGFVAGFIHPDEFYRLMKSSKRRLAFPLLCGVLRNPAALPRLLSNVRKVEAGDSAELTGTLCELSSIAVDPVSKGRGVGKGLVRIFIESAAGMGATSVYLTTDAVGNDYTNAFYRKLGFGLAGSFLSSGNRLMNKYVLSIEGTNEIN